MFNAYQKIACSNKNIGRYGYINKGCFIKKTKSKPQKNKLNIIKFYITQNTQNSAKIPSALITDCALAQIYHAKCKIELIINIHSHTKTHIIAFKIFRFNYTSYKTHTCHRLMQTKYYILRHVKNINKI